MCVANTETGCGAGREGGRRLDVKQVWLKVKGIKVKGPETERPRELAPVGSHSQPGLEAGEAPSDGSPEQPRAGEDAGRAP